MSLPTPTGTGPSRSSSSPRAKLALAQSRTARPVRLDLPGLGEGSGGWGSPAGALAPVGGGAAGWETPSRAADLPLSDLVDRASAQVVILRRVLDEASAADRAVRSHAGDLAQRLQQGQRFVADFDQRLAQAGRAAGVLEKASGAIAALGTVVEQIRSAQDAVARTYQAKLDAQRQDMERRLEEVASGFERRASELERRFEERLAELSARADAAATAGEEKVGEARRRAEADAELTCAKIDRHAAQAQARVSLILDGASDRLETMERQVERLGGSTMDAVDAMCARAAALLGRDPRRQDAEGAAPEGSLAAELARAKELVDRVDEAGVRIMAIRSEADAGIERLEAAVRLAAEAASERLPAVEALRRSIDGAVVEAARTREALATAAATQADAAARSAEASALLSRQREDLQAIGEASRYHVEQARSADAALRSSIEESRVKAEALRAAMGVVTEQAASMVELAKRVAGLVKSAEERGEGRAEAA